MEQFSNNMKKVLLFFLICFILLISYLTFYYVIYGSKVVSTPFNSRLWVERKRILRGTIYDRDLNVLTEAKRNKDGTQKLIYHGGESFSHVLGYMHSVYGLTGLQNLYDNELMGKRKNGFLSIFNKEESSGYDKGYDLKTTLNSKLQKSVSKSLGNNKGAVVVINPQTGEIISMVSKPDYNPNTLDEDWKKIIKNDDKPLFNRAVSGMYPPASTFKLITAVAALENIKDIRSRKINDTGVLLYNDNEILINYNKHSLGEIDLREAMIKSSNVFFGKLGLELGNQILKDTAERFYFNTDIPSDGIIIDNSRFPELKKQEIGNIAQSAIGQSFVLATPMEMAIVASTIANNGVMMKPMLVSELMFNEKVVKKIEPDRIERVISTKNASIIKEYMRDVVKEGTGRNASVYGIQVCGKTGTAEHEGGNKEKPHSWFVGFAPYDNPQIAFAVIVEEGGVGSGKAASIVKSIVSTAKKEKLIE